MDRKPKFKIELTTTDRILEITGWASLAVLWIVTLFYFRLLPETIPTHFNAAGIADDHGPKASVFILPAIGTILFIGLTILNRFPHIFNYPVKITPENRLRQFTMATRLVRVLKVSMLVVFILIIWSASAAAINKSNSIGIWFTPVILAIVFIPLGYYIYRSFKAK